MSAFHNEGKGRCGRWRRNDMMKRSPIRKGRSSREACVFITTSFTCLTYACMSLPIRWRYADSLMRSDIRLLPPLVAGPTLHIQRAEISFQYRTTTVFKASVCLFDRNTLELYSMAETSRRPSSFEVHVSRVPRADIADAPRCGVVRVRLTSLTLRSPIIGLELGPS